MEDLIDFPCSADWLDYYHQRGLTPRSSGRMSPQERYLLSEIRDLQKRMVTIEETLLEVVKAVKELLEERRKRRAKPAAKEQSVLEDSKARFLVG